MNMFIHLTYDGEVDVDAIKDPVLRLATIAQINNFGQTPKLLFHRPHPRKTHPDLYRRLNENIMIDTSALAWYSHSTPPLCVAGANNLIILNKVSYGQVMYVGNVKGQAVGDMRVFTRDKVIALPQGSAFLPPLCKTFLRYANPNGFISVHNYK